MVIITDDQQIEKSLCIYMLSLNLPCTQGMDVDEGLTIN